VLGIDARGREALSFVPGEVPTRPLPPWSATDEALAALARLQRRLHEAAGGFEAPDGARWDLPADVPGLTPLPEEAPELVGRCDITPDNWDEGVGDRIRRAQTWLERERPALAAHLDGPAISPGSRPGSRPGISP